MSDLAPVLAIFFSMLIPIVAIIGGITAGIIKSNGRRRIIENAQRERIAAIERGIDPDKFPSLNLPPDLFDAGLTFYQRQQRRSQALMIWGFVLTLFGAALFVGVGLEEHEFRKAAPVLMFVGVGVALLLSGWLVRPGPEDERREQMMAPTPRL
jgi:hypothetical protein